jgi:hypothetical protein
MNPKHTFGLVAAIWLPALFIPGAALAATYDLTGTWSYATSGNWVTGVCPVGKDSSGALEIIQTGDAFTLKLLSGAVCNPASMCSYTGTIAGAVYKASNSAVVDSEGGKVTNTITFTATSVGAASGTGGSQYTHPSGTTCTWGFNITLSRPTPDGGGPGKDKGGGLPTDAGTKADGLMSKDGSPVTPDKGVRTDAAGTPGQSNGGSGCQIGGGVPANLGLLALLALPLWLGRRVRLPALPRTRRARLEQNRLHRRER